MCLSLPCRRVLGFEFGLGCFCGCWDLTCFVQLVVLWMLRVWRTSKTLLLCTCDLAPFARKKRPALLSLWAWCCCCLLRRCSLRVRRRSSFSRCVGSVSWRHEPGGRPPPRVVTGGGRSSGAAKPDGRPPPAGRDGGRGLGHRCSIPSCEKGG